MLTQHYAMLKRNLLYTGVRLIKRLVMPGEVSSVPFSIEI